MVGFDSNFSYMKLIKAVTFLNKADCVFIATNEDTRLPANSDVIIPGKVLVLLFLTGIHTDL